MFYIYVLQPLSVVATFHMRRTSGTSEAELRNWPFYKSIDFAYLTQPIHLYIDTPKDVLYEWTA